MAIGQAGQIITNSPAENAPLNGTFDKPLTDPVIVLTGANGGQRVQLSLQDEEAENGSHAAETLGYIAIQQGVAEPSPMRSP